MPQDKQPMPFAEYKSLPRKSHQFLHRVVRFLELLRHRLVLVIEIFVLVILRPKFVVLNVHGCKRAPHLRCVVYLFHNGHAHDKYLA